VPNKEIFIASQTPQTSRALPWYQLDQFINEQEWRAMR
jgi:hypothetical protein